MDDPIITTRAAAKLLGVSIRTAQVWIEQNAIESWKTPGGHRRVRRSAVTELMGRLKPHTAQPSTFAVIHASEHRLGHYCDALAATPEYAVVADGDAYAALLSIGVLMPSIVIVELNRMDRDRLTMIRRIGQHPALGHTQLLVISPLGAAHLAAETELGERLHVLGVEWTEAELQARVRGLLGQADEAARQLVVVDSAPEGASEGARDTPVPANEARRLQAVAAAGLLDTPEEEAFDEITQLAAQWFDAPIALLTLLTPDRQWFKSHFGLERTETPRSWAFCNFTVLENHVLVVEDAATDARFARNPFVTGEPHIRFYAGTPVRDVQGYPLGSLCVLDRAPRHFDDTQRATLTTLGSLASDRINLRIRERQLRWAQNKTH
ncbi:excisionase family DNA-binding protein [Paraburkholderia bryophila]|uniref:GAF domain-containing protein n=1 Tax=Paraburkholderia bryophila TaxID=420952 RepID=UPI002349D3A7|nr:GAF domain-containing protein [Paraburkholderia bryophila]WCM24233.1 excisionase family DNA-binding protein [Paraburkholderia bryophila]